MTLATTRPFSAVVAAETEEDLVGHSGWR
jgi:hypothetical protein